ncbi:MAG: helix-turn-helix domain-containing protein [Methanobacteriota archaeon]
MFTSIFGESPQVRVLDFLAGHHDFDYTVTEIARNSGVARPTVYKVLEDFVEKGFVVATREVGASTFYKLDAEHPSVRGLLAADLAASHARRPAAKKRGVSARTR